MDPVESLYSSVNLLYEVLDVMDLDTSNPLGVAQNEWLSIIDKEEAFLDLLLTAAENRDPRMLPASWVDPDTSRLDNMCSSLPDGESQFMVLMDALSDYSAEDALLEVRKDIDRLPEDSEILQIKSDIMSLKSELNELRDINVFDSNPEYRIRELPEITSIIPAVSSRYTGKKYPSGFSTTAYHNQIAGGLEVLIDKQKTYEYSQLEDECLRLAAMFRKYDRRLK